MLRIIIIIYKIQKKLEKPIYLLEKLLIYLGIKLNITFYDIFLINHLGSNHSKRLHLLSEFYNKNKGSKTAPYAPQQNIYKNIFIVGDSHAEYHGRNFERINKKFQVNFKSIWTGPNLLIDFCNNKFVSNSVIKKLKRLNANKELNLILCYGEIDLRVAFYRLLNFNKKFNNENYLIEFYVKNLVNKISEFKKELNLLFNFKVNIFFKEITPPTNIDGELPNNLEELKKIMKNNEFPTLGDKFDRANWSKKLNFAIKNSSIKKSFLSIPTSGYNSDGMINKEYSDNHHFTDDRFLELCQESFLNEINNVTSL